MLSKDIYIPDLDWHEVGEVGEPAYENSWETYSATWGGAKFRIDSDGWVHLAGLVKNGTNGTAVFTLPEGYRPSGDENPAATVNRAFGLGCNNSMTGQIVYIFANTDGEVFVGYNSGTNGWVSLYGVQFPTAPRSERNRRNMVSRTIDAYERSAVPHMELRSNGMVCFEGVADAEAAGASYRTMADWAPIKSTMFAVRDNTATAKRTDFSPVHGNYWVHATTDYAIMAGEWAHPSINHKWITPSYSNSWVAYGQDSVNNWSGLQYYKDHHGFVHLNGLMKSGSSATAVMATLPEGYRPETYTMFPTYSAAGGAARVDVRSDGVILASQNGSTTYTSLAGINFYAGW